MDPLDPLDHEIARHDSVHKKFLTMLWVVIWAIINTALAKAFIFPLSALLGLVIGLSSEQGGQGNPLGGPVELTQGLLLTLVSFVGWFLVATFVNYTIWAWGFRRIRNSTYMMISCIVDCAPAVIGLVYTFVSNWATRGNAIS